MNNFDYQMFLNGNDDEFSEMFLQGTTSNMPSSIPLFNNGMNTMPNNNNMNNSTNNNMNGILYTPYEGFTKGNMFRNLYEPFMNYTPIRLTPKNAQEEALLNLDQMHFAMHELNLYLDNYPDDKQMIDKFNEFRTAYEKLLNEYQSKYGPIEITSPYMTTSPFAWTKDAWPWDRRNF